MHEGVVPNVAIVFPQEVHVAAAAAMETETEIKLSTTAICACRVPCNS